MKFTKITALLLAMLMAGLFMTSCEEEDDPVNPVVETPDPATNFRALSFDATTIHLNWDASPSETNALFNGYTLSITSSDANETFSDVTIPSGTATPFPVAGLVEGNIYTFELVTEYSNGESSTAATVVWSPATRLETDPFDGPIRLFSSDSQFGSGLDLWDAGQDGALSKTVSNGGDWDLGFYTQGGVVIFGSASELQYNFTEQPDETHISSEISGIMAPASPPAGYSPLNAIFNNGSLADKGTYAARTIDLTESQYQGNDLVFYVRKFEPGQTDYNYARVALLWSAADNSFVWTDGGESFLTVHVSYQKVADVPYAGVKPIK